MEAKTPLAGQHPDQLAQVTPDKTFRVGFVLLDHFSLMSYASAVDTLVTANLVTNRRLFSHSNYAIPTESRQRSIH